MSTTFVPPITHAQSESDLGHAYIFGAERARAVLHEEWDAWGAGVVRGYGDLVGSGSDTIRLVHYDGLGFAETFQPLGETEEATPTGHTTGYDTLSIARYGLVKEESYQNAILSTPEAKVEFGIAAMLNSHLVRSWLATVRNLWAVSMSAFSNVIGTAGQAWTFDDELDVIAYFRETEGYNVALHGMPIVARHPKQLTQLREAIRNEPGMQGSAELLQRLLGLGDNSGGGFDFLELHNLGTWEVQTSGGDYIGGAYLPGAVGYVTASTLPLGQLPGIDPTSAVLIPELGLILQVKHREESGVVRVLAQSWFGMANRDATVFPQTRIRSVTS